MYNSHRVEKPDTFILSPSVFRGYELAREEIDFWRKRAMAAEETLSRLRNALDDLTGG